MAMRYSKGALAVALLFTSLVQGCGFHLAGDSVTQGVMKDLVVQDEGASHELVQFIRGYAGADKNDAVALGPAVIYLDIVSEGTEKEVLSLDPRGKAREYDLLLKITFDVKRADSTNLLPRQGLHLSRVFVFDKHDVLGSAEEEERLLQEMRKDAARLIVQRISAAQAGPAVTP